MPSVLEAPETVEVEQVEQYYKTLSPMSAPRPGVVSTIITFLSGVAIYLRPPNHQHRQNQPSAHEPEMPLDILAREHPYMYSTALAG